MAFFLSLLFAVGCVLALEEFRYFRCDSCRASLHQITKALKGISVKRKTPLAEHEYVDLMEGVCQRKLTKEEYGVKTFDGRSYLFGPGVKDHISGQGFSQMGMGDYDMRLRSYCSMFVEHFDETALYNEFRKNDEILIDQRCKVECESDSSGTGPGPSHSVTPQPVQQEQKAFDRKYTQILEEARSLSVDDKIKLMRELELTLQNTKGHSEL